MTTCPKRVLDFWQAYDRVECLPSPWQQTAKVCAQVESLVGIQYAKAGVKDYKNKSEIDFMPPQWVQPKTISAPQSEEELNKAVEIIGKRCQT